MTSWLTFVVGIIVGLLIGWVVELIYGRRTRAARGPEPVEPALAVSEAVEPQVGAPIEPNELPAAGDEVELAQAERAPGEVSVQDKLIVIEGIGPAYEARLHAGGIQTFRQLAEAEPERLREIIQPQAWQQINFADWIEQARLIVEGKDEELRSLQARLYSRKKG